MPEIIEMKRLTDEFIAEANKFIERRKQCEITKKKAEKTKNVTTK